MLAGRSAARIFALQRQQTEGIRQIQVELVRLRRPSPTFNSGDNVVIEYDQTGLAGLRGTVVELGTGEKRGYVLVDVAGRHAWQPDWSLGPWTP